MLQSQCVCFLLISGQKVLLEHRPLSDRAGFAEFNVPGGHVEPGESLEETLRREVEEELNVIPLSYHYIASLPFQHIESQLLHYFCVTQWSGEIQAQERALVSWHTFSEELAVSPNDRSIISEVLSLELFDAR